MSVMPVHVECAKRAFSVLALSTKNYNAFILITCFSIFINRNLSLRVYTADINSLYITLGDS